MKNRTIIIINLAILGFLLLDLSMAAGFHRINVNRKYWKMLNAGCINTNAFVNLEKITGETDLANDHMTSVPKWIADDNATRPYGNLILVFGFIMNAVLLIRTIGTKTKSEPTGVRDSSPATHDP